MKIYLKKLELENWGPYREKQQIEFSLDPEKNVTYIIGKNSTGKTKLFQAIKWVLFGETGENEFKSNIINVESQSLNKDCRVEVNLFFTTEDDISSEKYNYKVTRRINFNGTTLKGIFFYASACKEGSSDSEPLKEQNFQDMLEIFIPKGLREFFFLDGENLVKNFRSNINEIKHFATKISIIPSLETIRDQLNKYLQDITKKSETLSNKNKKVISGILEEALDIQKELDESDHLRLFITELKEILKKLIKMEEDYIRMNIEAETSSKYVKLIWRADEWKGIQIDKDWNFFLITQNDQRIISTELSMGMCHVLGISFLSSLPSVTNLDLPFLFDSPFGRISNESIANIGKYLPSIMKGTQIIIFLTDSEEKSIFPHIKMKIGRKYELIYRLGVTRIVPLPT